MRRSVVVTGANSGIGLATALELAAHDFDVVGTVRSEAKGEALHAAAAERGLVVDHVVCDVADAAATERAFAAVAARTDGGPWAVVNNAGHAQPGAIEDVTDDAARRQLDVNVLAPARIARLVLPRMRERRDGRIVMMSSIAGRMTLPLVGWYAASKQALEAVSDALRIEVARYGVRVVLIEPGSFDTSIWQRGAELVPERPDSPYAGSYALADRYRHRARLLPDPVRVARTVRHALTVRNPRRRYLVGLDAMLGAAFESATPDAVADYVKGLAAGVRRPPFR